MAQETITHVIPAGKEVPTVYRDESFPESVRVLLKKILEDTVKELYGQFRPVDGEKPVLQSVVWDKQQGHIHMVFPSDQVTQEWFDMKKHDNFTLFLKSTLYNYLSGQIVHISFEIKDTKGKTYMDKALVVHPPDVQMIQGQFVEWLGGELNRIENIQEMKKIMKMENIDVDAVLNIKRGRPRGAKKDESDVAYISGVTIFINDFLGPMAEYLRIHTNDFKDKLRELIPAGAGGGGVVAAGGAAVALTDDALERLFRSTTQKGKKPKSKKSKDAVPKKQSSQDGRSTKQAPKVRGHSIEDQLRQLFPQGTDVWHYIPVGAPDPNEYLRYMVKTMKKQKGVTPQVLKRLYQEHDGDLPEIQRQLSMTGGAAAPASSKVAEPIEAPRGVAKMQRKQPPKGSSPSLGTTRRETSLRSEVAEPIEAPRGVEKMPRKQPPKGSSPSLATTRRETSRRSGVVEASVPAQGATTRRMDVHASPFRPVVGSVGRPYYPIPNYGFGRGPSGIGGPQGAGPFVAPDGRFVYAMPEYLPTGGGGSASRRRGGRP